MPMGIDLVKQFGFVGRRDVVYSNDIPGTGEKIGLGKRCYRNGKNGFHWFGMCNWGYRLAGVCGVSKYRVFNYLNSLV